MDVDGKFLQPEAFFPRLFRRPEKIPPRLDIISRLTETDIKREEGGGEERESVTKDPILLPLT